MSKVTIYTDGACSGNPGPGGWAAILVAEDGRSKELFGSESGTTNNRMELTAAIKGLEALKKPCMVELVSDSQYVVKGASEWIHNWKLKGWRTAGKKSVENQDLWQRIDALSQTHAIVWKWVRGHNGHPMNERCDVLATTAIRKA